MKLTVITPCSRPENLPLIQQSLPECQWVVVMDSDSPVPAGLRAEVVGLRGGVWGNRQRNLGLSLAIGDYVYFLDDDNLMHPRLPELLEGLTGDIAMVEQAHPDGSRRLGVDWLPGELCDTAQFLVPHDLAQSIQWDPRYRESDIIYFSTLRHRHPERIRFIRETAAWYNFLRPEPPP